MKEFDYDIHKYIAYRKKQRDEAKKPKTDNVVEKEECKLSENAKKCIHDIERRLFNEEN